MRHTNAVHKNLILMLVVLVLTGCNRHGGSAPAKSAEMTAGEYEVLSQWIDDKFTAKARARGLDQVVIFDSTDSDDNRLRRDNNGQAVRGKHLRNLCAQRHLQSNKPRLMHTEKPTRCRPRFVPSFTHQFTTKS